VARLLDDVLRLLNRLRAPSEPVDHAAAPVSEGSSLDALLESRDFRVIPSLFPLFAAADAQSGQAARMIATLMRGLGLSQIAWLDEQARSYSNTFSQDGAWWQLTPSAVRQRMRRSTGEHRVRCETARHELVPERLRVSELIGLHAADVVLTAGAHVRCIGKGRKERCTPLTGAIGALRDWLRERQPAPGDYLFPSRRGGPLSRDAVERLVDKYVAAACATCPSLRSKHVTPYVLRHTTAVELLRAGNDATIVALYLKHESIATTQIYIDADLEVKERALARTAPPGIRRGRFRPGDPLLAFLSTL
jgi:hypothetical protein